MAQILDLGKLRFNWAGDWNQATEYEYNDVVKYGPNVYAYVAPNSSIGTVPTDTSKWLLIIEGVRYRGAYTSGVEYFVNDIVTDEFSSYITLTKHTATSNNTDVPELTTLAVGAGSLPSQENNAGKVLSTDGTDAEWVTSLELDKVSISENKGAQAVAFEADNELTDVVSIFTQGSEDFVQLAIANTQNGENASVDFIAYTADGDNDSGFIDMGITSKDFSAENFGITGPHDGYIFMSAPRVNEAEVTAYSTTAAVAELETLAAHGYAVGQEVHIENVGPNYDGVKIVTAVPAGNKFRFVGAVENQPRQLLNPYGAVYRPAGKGNLVLATDGTGTENKIIIAAGGFASGTTQMAITPDENVHIEIATQSTDAASGALTVVGGVGIHGAASIDGLARIKGYTYVGEDAETFAEDAELTNAFTVVKLEGGPYAQVAIHNSTPDASTDVIVYSDNGTDSSGWMDMGITGSEFDQSEFGLTGPNDGYVFLEAPEGTTGKGNLVIATGDKGTENAIIIAAGGFATGREQIKVIPDQMVHIEIDTPSTSATTGALVIAGGVGITGDVNIAGNISFGGEGTQVGTVNLAVSDPMIFVGNDSETTDSDLAFVGESKYVIDITWTKTVVNKALTNNVATLTLTEDHGDAGYDWEIGDTVVVQGVGAPFDGSFEITAFPTANTVSYAVTSVNIPSTRVGDTVYTITEAAILNNVATIKTSGFHDLQVGETIVLANVGAAFNGSHVIVTSSQAFNEFTLAIVDNNVTLTGLNGTGTVNRSTATTVVDNPIRTRWSAWSKDVQDDGVWKLTSNIRTKPTNQIPYTQADIVYDRVKFGGYEALGNSSVTGTLDVSSTFRVATNKFQVASTTGNTTVAGKINLAGNLEIATDKFVVDSTTGATTVASTLAIADDFSVATNKFTVDGATGDVYTAGKILSEGEIRVTNSGSTLFVVDGSTGFLNSGAGASFGELVEFSDNVTIFGTPSDDLHAATVEYVHQKAIANWQYKTANYAAVADDMIAADTSAGSWTIDLPGSPANNTVIQLHDVAGTWESAPLIVNAGVKTIMGVFEPLNLDIANATVKLVFIGAVNGWRIV